MTATLYDGDRAMDEYRSVAMAAQFMNVRHARPGPLRFNPMAFVHAF